MPRSATLSARRRRATRRSYRYPPRRRSYPPTGGSRQKPAKDFSSGWRMRIALALALFVKLHLLLLDETNHLDLDACVWLEEELKTYKRILVLISHSQDFLNGVCTNIIHLTGKRLKSYTANYEAFVRTSTELLENQVKQYNWEQSQMAHMKDYIARFGHGSAKLISQVANEIWVCEKERVTKWKGGILDYKEHLKNKIEDEQEKNAKAGK